MIQSALRGSGVALVTPFRKDGSVDYDALGRLIDPLHWRWHRVSGIFSAPQASQ
jgi:dihydrodipicolinate synthase/N-acetylneuraminate lyase